MDHVKMVITVVEKHIFAWVVLISC